MKKVIKSLCFSLLAFMFAIGSIFLPIGKQPQKYASADNTVIGNTVFTSSDIFSVRVGNTNSSAVAQDFSSCVPSAYSDVYAWYLNHNFRIRLEDNGSFTFFIKASINENIGFVTNTGSFAGNFVEVASLIPTYGRWTATFNVPIRYRIASNYYYTPINVRVFTPRDSTPTLLMESIEIGSVQSFIDLDTDFNSLSQELGGNNGNCILYTDTSGYRFMFCIPTWIAYDSTSQEYYSYRKYYTSYNSSFNNNQYYEQGLKDGTAQGYDNGYNIGYREGSSVGYEDGFENGKIEGVLESNNYSFFGLFSAIIDAPVKILTSLFNFEFLGVNLWAFFTSILTISLIIFVIRKFMAKG